MRYLLPHVIAVTLYVPLRMNALEINYLSPHVQSLPERMSQLVYILPAYLALIIAPAKLTFNHGVPQDYFPVFWYLVAGWLAIAVVGVYLFVSKNRIVMLGTAWFIIFLVPNMNIIAIPSSAMAERYLYLPMIGVLAAVSDRILHGARPRCPQRVVAVVTVMMVIVCAVLTFRRNFDWKDDFVVNKALVAADPSAALPHCFLGYQCFLRGDKVAAEKEWKTSVALDPRHGAAGWAFYNLGFFSLERAERERAERLLERAANADPVNAVIHYALGRLYEQRGRAQDAYREDGLFFRGMTLGTSHLIPEVNNKMLAFEGRVPTSAPLPEVAPRAGLK